MEPYRRPTSQKRTLPKTDLEEKRQRASNVTLEVGGQLTMGIIGCLPDNVQQAIKSFSIRNGKQHVTFAFPFMEHLIRGFDRSRTAEEIVFENLTPALFFDSCPEIIHGFETLVTLTPNSSRNNHLIGLLTVSQKGTTEGFRNHMVTLFKILMDGKAAIHLKNLPFLVIDVREGLLQEAVNACADTILEMHGDNFLKAHPGKSMTEVTDMIKEGIVRPKLITYKELLHRNIQEVEEKLRKRPFVPSAREIEKFDTNQFHSLLAYLQSNTCTPSEFKQIHSFLMSPSINPAVQQFWRVWKNEQIAAKVFPVCQNKSNTDTLGCQIVTKVPVKEGLINVIKCLKNQDLGIASLQGYPIYLDYSPRDEKWIRKPQHVKECKCSKSTIGWSWKNNSEAVCGTSSGLLRAVSNPLGYPSAFHTPRSANTNSNRSLFVERTDQMLLKLTSSYLYSHRNKSSINNGKFLEIKDFNHQERINNYPAIIPHFPILLGYFNSTKDSGSSVNFMQSPVVGATLVYNQQMYANSIKANWQK